MEIRARWPDLLKRSNECRSSNISRSLRGYGCVNSIWKTGRFCCAHSLGLSLANTRNWSSKSIETHRTWATISRPALLREMKSKWRCRQKSRCRSKCRTEQVSCQKKTLRHFRIHGASDWLPLESFDGSELRKGHAVRSARVVHHLATCCRRLLLTSSWSLERTKQYAN